MTDIRAVASRWTTGERGRSLDPSLWDQGVRGSGFAKGNTRDVSLFPNTDVTSGSEVRVSSTIDLLVTRFADLTKYDEYQMVSSQTWTPNRS
jgi:hypothetical protein